MTTGSLYSLGGAGAGFSANVVLGVFGVGDLLNIPAVRRATYAALSANESPRGRSTKYHPTKAATTITASRDPKPMISGLMLFFVDSAPFTVLAPFTSTTIDSDEVVPSL